MPILLHNRGDREPRFLEVSLIIVSILQEMLTIFSAIGSMCFKIYVRTFVPLKIVHRDPISTKAGMNGSLTKVRCIVANGSAANAKKHFLRAKRSENISLRNISTSSPTPRNS
jgi:hypothetical protein